MDKTTILPKVGSYEFTAEPFHCDFSHHLFIGHLGNHMLNAADYHSSERGYGMNYLNPMHKTWVLSRLAIEMTSMPKAYDRFHVSTWVENAMRYFTSRNFAVSSQEDGRVYGYGRSIWALIDTDTRQPTDILGIRDGLINEYIDTETPCPIAKPSRVMLTPDAPLVRTVDTCYSDIDVNGHVNSVKYIEHVLDLFPLSQFSGSHIERFEVAYVAESYYGDRLLFYKEECADGTFAIRIDKTTKNGGEQIEVCRSKVKFAKD